MLAKIGARLKVLCLDGVSSHSFLDKLPQHCPRLQALRLSMPLLSQKKDWLETLANGMCICSWSLRPC